MFEIISSVIFFWLMVLWCYYKWSNRRVHKLASKLKGPLAYPLFGSLLEFIGTNQHVLETLIKLMIDYGPEPFKLWLGPFVVIIINNPDDVKIVLNSSKLLRKSWPYKFGSESFGEGLVTSAVDKWRKHRRIITPAFNTKLLEQFFPIFNGKYSVLMINLKKEVGRTETFNLWDYIAPTTIHTICQTAMGYNLNAQSNVESEFETGIIKAQELHMLRVKQPWLYPNVVYSIYKQLSGAYKVFDSLNKLPMQVIEEKKRAFASKKLSNKVVDINDDEKNKIKIFVDILLELNDTGAGFSDKDLRDEVVTMMIGGSETTAITSCFCLLLLAIHPDIQDKVYEEIYDVFGEDVEPNSIEDTNKLRYLEQVLMETLRLYPPVVVFSRETEEDVKIVSGNYVLPKGTMVAICPIDTHRRPELYPNPLAFNPENFNQENIAKRHKYSFIPFSGGARGCLGSKYAMVSMKLLIVKLLRNFSVHTDIKLSDIRLEVDMLMRSANGYPVTIRSRNRRQAYS